MNIEKFRNSFINDNCTAAIVTDPKSRYYLSGISTSDGIIAVTPNFAYYIVDFRYIEAVKRAFEKSKFFKVIELDRPAFEIIDGILKSENIKRVAFENLNVTYEKGLKFLSLYKDYEVTKIGSAIYELRQTKTPEELLFIREAQKITDAAFSHILNIISGKMTEREVALELEIFMKRQGAEELAFETICVSGKNSSMPHGTPGNELIAKNSFTTMDFGARYCGYCADMTRTVVLGTADEEMNRVYATVLEAQTSAISAIRHGVYGKDIDKIARDIINNSGYEGTFGHSLGHSVGLDIHERPCFSSNSPEIIKTGSVLSVEPGIYLENKYGVRIEDLVIVTENGCENITKSEKKLLEIQ